MLKLRVSSVDLYENVATPEKLSSARRLSNIIVITPSAPSPLLVATLVRHFLCVTYFIFGASLPGKRRAGGKKNTSCTEKLWSISEKYHMVSVGAGCGCMMVLRDDQWHWIICAKMTFGQWSSSSAVVAGGWYWLTHQTVCEKWFWNVVTSSSALGGCRGYWYR